MNPRPSAYKAIDALPNIASAQLLQEFLASPESFFTYLCSKGISDSWAKKYTRIAIRYANEAKDGIDAKAFLERYQNANTYNNMLKAIIHLHRFLNIPEPDLKFKPITKDRLIIAPSYEEIMAGLKAIHKNVDLVRFYLLCSTTLLRPQFIVTLNWEHIDLTNKLINVKVDKKTKHYRPQILHSALIPYIEDKQGKVFAHTYDYYGKKIRMLTGITPSRLRDFAYNAMLKSGMNYLVVEWLMGHNIGMAAHYLADNIREEYTKFERAYTFNIDT